MFISGFILLYIFYFLFIILLSVGVNFLTNYTGTNSVNGIAAGVLIYLEFYELLDIFLYAGTIIMILLHKKRLSTIVIWVCVACFFGGLIIEFIGLCGVKFFYTYLTKITYLFSLGFGIFFYWKLANDNQDLPNSDTQLLAMDNRI